MKLSHKFIIKHIRPFSTGHHMAAYFFTNDLQVIVSKCANGVIFVNERAYDPSTHRTDKDAYDFECEIPMGTQTYRRYLAAFNTEVDNA